MRIRLLAALVVATGCILLTGLSMPDAPRPQRHARSQVQTMIEERAAQRGQQARVSNRTKKNRDAGGNARSLEEAATKAKRRQAERSARTLLPSQKLR